MRILVLGNQDIVSSVSAGEMAAGLIITINTRDRWIGYHRSGSSSLLSRESGFVDAHDCILLSASESEADQCEVVLIAESLREKVLLRGVAYMSQDKDQISCLKVSPSYLMNAKELARYSSPAAGKSLKP